MSSLTASSRIDTAISFVVSKRLYDLHTSMPCEVIAVDLGKESPTVDVKILWEGISQETPSLNYKYPDVLDVPLMVYGVSPEIKMTMPVKVGTRGVVYFPEKPLYGFNGKDKATVQVTPDLTAFPLMGLYFIPTYQGGTVDPENIVIKHTNTTITITKEGVQIVAPSGLDCNGAKITPDGDVLTASGVSLNKVRESFNPHTHGGGPTPSTSI